MATSTYAEIPKGKVSIENKQGTTPHEAAELDVRMKVKDVIRKYRRLIRETVDVNKSVMTMTKREDIKTKYKKTRQI